MTTLRIRTEEYSTMRHQLGLTTSAPNFITYREALNANTITIDNAVAWATEPAAAPTRSIGAVG
jgi:hypothetical protein